jgi:cytosine/adenosine deaminase-related metal-dependent hydrolase
MAATRGGAAGLARQDAGVLRTGAVANLNILDSHSWIHVAYHLGGGGGIRNVGMTSLPPTGGRLGGWLI